MAKLLFFSGGVESTALLTQLNPEEDYVVVLKRNLQNTDQPNTLRYMYDDVHGGALLDHYGIANVIHWKITHSLVHDQAHDIDQRWMYYPAIVNLLPQLPFVHEVQFGFNSAEPVSGITGTYAIFKKWMKEFFPSVSITEPFNHLSKHEQYDLIDPAVRHHVISCPKKTHDDRPHDPENCGKCRWEKEASGWIC